MKNKIAQSINGVIAQSAEAEKGAQTHGATIGLVRMTAAVMLVIRTAAILALSLYDAAKKTLADKRVLLDAKVLEVRLLVALARDLLKPARGTPFNQNWEGTGFRESLEVPYNPGNLLVIVRGLEGFYTANPGLESAPHGVTAAAMKLMGDELEEAIGAVNNQEAAVGARKADRDTKLKAVGKSVRDLIKELSTILDPLDPLWKAFGLNLPGAQHIPAVPLNVIATLMGPNVVVQWGASERAEYYRVFKRVIGVDAELVPVGTQNGLDLVLAGLPANAQVQLAVSAVNNGGESPVSSVVTVQTTA
jgi:hypothetical protein